MQYNKTFEAGGFAVLVSAILMSSFLLYTTVFRYMIDIVTSLQGTGLHRPL